MNIRRLITALSLSVVISFCHAQGLNYTPPAVAAYVNVGAGWIPYAAGASFGAISFTPPAYALYCQASSGAQWTPCQPSAGAGSVGTVGQLQMVGATAGTFAASSLTDNGSKVTSFEPIFGNSAPAEVDLNTQAACNFVADYFGNCIGMGSITGPELSLIAAGYLSIDDAIVMHLGSLITTTNSFAFDNAYALGNNMMCWGWSNSATAAGFAGAAFTPQAAICSSGAGIVNIGTGTRNNTLGTLHVSHIGSGVSTNTDLDGTITLAAGTGSFTFSGTYTSAPICVANDTTALQPVKPTVTTTTLTLTGTTTDVIEYACFSRN